ncbi:MAG: ferredoxin [Candidatus Omnitrophica bacterium CG12_big_fil_rev_8_21_14_0_65_43_15]|uniref:Ferredoxin n=1 Tax=Candidatus Taenaricola geysiri TaxID=1974752 RepID=A0A2J0LT73_9BACT|nr:MAG: ferredoxin [Candidatus Omnitrophica bacterium CG12_big_fil_rev_8_21_14_0_65_43_15]PIW80453.1 MAG: ferredoxin [Candidatus Omnitrophica bacterium CG_4_8_14_3_um_filter_43_15]
MAKKMAHLIFPQKLIKKPVIFTMAKKYNVIPNIRRANVTETVGEVTLELSGTKENLEKARKYLERAGVKVEPVVGDIVE